MSYNVLIRDGAKPVKMWTEGVPVEHEAQEQLVNTAKLPFIFKHVAVMPDVHLGKGATIGSVIPTKGAIIPAAVGVDIGCGMVAVQTSLTASDLPESMKDIRLQIERDVPVGKGVWKSIPKAASSAWNSKYWNTYSMLSLKHKGILAKSPDAQLGTLGGGNHFIEVCLDKSDNVWVMLHSGSRGMGNRIGMYFIEAAKKDMERFMIQLPDRDLAYIPEGSDLFNDYVTAVSLAQDYARDNRDIMLGNVLQALARHTGPFTLVNEAVNCHHNYIAKEHHFDENVWVTRKGAVRAREGDLGIIPGSMGARSFIVRGKGNPDSFHSCSHGAGRVMSRTKAKELFTIEDQEIATMGIECRKDEGVIDEIPMAYKDIDAVMAAQEDLVEVVAELRQVVCVKG